MTAVMRPYLKTGLRRLAVRLICLVAAAIALIALPFGARGKDFKGKTVRKIMVIRLDLLGDLVLTMPAIQALREAHPQAAISMLVLPYTAPLLAHYPFLDSVFTYDINRLRPSGRMLSSAPYRELWRLLCSLRAERFDLAVSFHGVWAGMFAFASGAPFRAGYNDESCPFMLNLPVRGKRYRVRRHEADYCLDLARALGAPGQGYGLTLTPLPSAELAVDKLFGRPGPALPIAFHAGATNGSAKRWTPQGMAELADRLIAEEGATIIFTGSKGDLPAVEEVRRLMKGSALDLVGITTITELVALLSRCRLLVSGDSGPLHLANALGVPVVAIHGPTDPALSGPYGGRAIVVRKEVPCGPCYDLSATADCPRNDPICMKGISVAEVYAAVRQHLAVEPPVDAD